MVGTFWFPLGATNGEEPSDRFHNDDDACDTCEAGSQLAACGQLHTAILEASRNVAERTTIAPILILLGFIFSFIEAGRRRRGLCVPSCFTLVRLDSFLCFIFFLVAGNYYRHGLRHGPAAADDDPDKISSAILGRVQNTVADSRK